MITQPEFFDKNKLKLTLLDWTPPDLEPQLLNSTIVKNPHQNLIDAFLQQNKELTLPEYKTINNFTNKFNISQYSKKNPHQSTIIRKLITNDIDGITFLHDLTQIYRAEKHTISELISHNKLGCLVDYFIFHLPRFFDVLSSVQVDLVLPANKIARSTVYLEGTILGQSIHNNSTTIDINVSQTQTCFGRLKVDVEIFSDSPIFDQTTKVQVTTSNIVFNHSWIRELIDQLFLPIPTNFSLLTEFSRRVVLSTCPPPLVVNGWPYLMPFTAHSIKPKLKFSLTIPKKIEIEEGELTDCSLEFPSGVVVPI